LQRVEILGSYAGVAEAVNGIALVKPDLVFLDIEMNAERGLNLA